MNQKSDSAALRQPNEAAEAVREWIHKEFADEDAEQVIHTFDVALAEERRRGDYYLAEGKRADRPPAGEAPRTEAERTPAKQRLWEYVCDIRGMGDNGELDELMDAIEAEAASAAPPEPQREAWTAGYYKGQEDARRSASPEPPRPLADNAADWHRYLHQEGMLVEDSPGEECGPWHHRVFLAAPPEPECSCGPWQIGQPQGHLPGCPRAAPERLDVDRLVNEQVRAMLGELARSVIAHQIGGPLQQMASASQRYLARLIESGSPPQTYTEVERLDRPGNRADLRGESGSPTPDSKMDERCGFCEHRYGEHSPDGCAAIGPTCSCAGFLSAPTPPGEEQES